LSDSSKNKLTSTSDTNKIKIETDMIGNGLKSENNPKNQFDSFNLTNTRKPQFIPNQL